MELMIPLSSQDPRPLYEQIYQYIKGEIRNGGLKPMKKLPSSRAVSYTHLDVYKRQPTACPPGSLRNMERMIGIRGNGPALTDLAG